MSDRDEFEAREVHADPPEDAILGDPAILHGPWKFGDDGEMRIALVGGSPLYQERFAVADGQYWEDGDPHPLTDEVLRLAAENRELLASLDERERLSSEHIARTARISAAVKVIADDRDRARAALAAREEEADEAIRLAHDRTDEAALEAFSTGRSLPGNRGFVKYIIPRPLDSKPTKQMGRDQ